MMNRDDWAVVSSYRPPLILYRADTSVRPYNASAGLMGKSLAGGILSERR